MVQEQDHPARDRGSVGIVLNNQDNNKPMKGTEEQCEYLQLPSKFTLHIHIIMCENFLDGNNG